MTTTTRDDRDPTGKANNAPGSMSPSSSVAEGDRHLDAVRRLVELAGRCAAEEQQIEQWLRQAARSAQREYEQQIETTRQSQQAARQSLQQSQQEELNETRRRFEAEYNAAKGEFDEQRSRVVNESDTVEQSARDELEQAVWLIDSMFEGQRDKLAQEFEELKQTVAIEHKSMQRMKEDAKVLLQRRGLAAPEEPQFPPARVSEDAKKDYARRRESVYTQFERMQGLARTHWARHVFTALTVVLAVGGLLALAAWYLAFWSYWYPAAGLGAAAGICMLIAVGSAVSRRNQLRASYLPLCQAIKASMEAAQRYLAHAEKTAQQQLAPLTEKRNRDVEAVKEKFAPLLQSVSRRRGTRMDRIEGTHAQSLGEIRKRSDLALTDMQRRHDEAVASLDREHERRLADLRAEHEHRLAELNVEYESRWRQLIEQWREGTDRAYGVIDEATSLAERVFRPWEDESWRQFEPAKVAPPFIPFGTLRVDLDAVPGGRPQDARLKTHHPWAFDVPATLAFPQRCSLLLRSGRDGRDAANAALAAVMTRLMTALPPGRAHFTIIDPVALGQNFAGFMHLADYEEALVGKRIWTETQHIEQQLTNLTEHMENVIQKFLRNEYETIDQYNAQAGELAEPYRFVVIADFPTNFTEESLHRLASIVNSGPRCGVYTLIAMDGRQRLTGGMEVADFVGGGTLAVHGEQGFRWRDEVLGHFGLTLAQPPTEQRLSTLMHAVGEAARDSSRIEVSYDLVAPSPQEVWTRECDRELRVPIGRAGATRMQELAFGRGVAQHALIGGKTGSGKSTLLHVLVTNIALWYSPDQVELYLIDFKKGVEFKTYATHDLPHARAVAIETDREFGLSVLQKLDAEMQRRGDLYRELGVQELAAYRKIKGKDSLPRALLIIDEFQEFFSEDDKLAQEATLLLDRLVRQGRAFGIHVLLGSQTLAGAYGLARSTIGQMAVRIALQCSEADSELIMTDGNSAARLLTRPGEAIYNDTGGLVEGNNPFQVAWLSDEYRDTRLEEVRALANERGVRRAEPLIVFEGNAPADLSKNQPLRRLLEQPGWPPSSEVVRAYLGEPIAIKDPTAAVFRRHSGSNLLIVGQRDEAATAMMLSSLVSLAAQHEPRAAQFWVMDGTAADSPLAGWFARVAEALPHDVRMVEWRQVEEAMVVLGAELQRRRDGEASGASDASIYLFVCGLQRYRMLRKREEEFSFSSSFDEESDKPKPPQADKVFADLLREGPPVGMHVVTWCDSPTTLNRTLDRQMLHEFDMRVLFQMSQTDSSNLIDSPVAGRLGLHRAVLYSEEQGVIEKFRPYALPSAAWLEQVRRLLGEKASGSGSR